MGYVDSLTGFEEHFIGGISPNAKLDFLDASILYLREEVFRPIVEVLQQGSGRIVVGSKFSLIEINIYTFMKCSGPTWSKPPKLACDCSFLWIIKDREVLAVFDDHSYDHQRPRCYDGTLLADLDVGIFDAFCPE